MEMTAKEMLREARKLWEKGGGLLRGGVFWVRIDAQSAERALRFRDAVGKAS